LRADGDGAGAAAGTTAAWTVGGCVASDPRHAANARTPAAIRTTA